MFTLISLGWKLLVVPANLGPLDICNHTPYLTTCYYESTLSASIRGNSCTCILDHTMWKYFGSAIIPFSYLLTVFFFLLGHCQQYTNVFAVFKNNPPNLTFPLCTTLYFSYPYYLNLFIISVLLNPFRRFTSLHSISFISTFFWIHSNRIFTFSVPLESLLLRSLMAFRSPKSMAKFQF